MYLGHEPRCEGCGVTFEHLKVIMPGITGASTAPWWSYCEVKTLSMHLQGPIEYVPNEVSHNSVKHVATLAKRVGNLPHTLNSCYD